MPQHNIVHYKKSHINSSRIRKGILFDVEANIEIMHVLFSIIVFMVWNKDICHYNYQMMRTAAS
jgi:hypothetical protein